MNKSKRMALMKHRRRKKKLKERRKAIAIATGVEVKTARPAPTKEEIIKEEPVPEKKKEVTKKAKAKPEAVEAVRKGKFHIYAVGTIDEGIEVLTGVTAGKRKKDGTYPKDSINCKVDKQLKEMATKLRHFYGPSTEEGKKHQINNAAG